MDLTDAWGPVPLITEVDVANATSSSYTSQPVPAPVERIDSMIISDLTTAASTLPVNYVNNSIYSSNDFGRATKGAALNIACQIIFKRKRLAKSCRLLQAGNGYECV